MNLSLRNTGNSYRERYLEQLAALQKRQQERLASGKRIARAADDSAGLAIAKRLEATVRGTAQGERNVADGQGVVRTAESSLQTSQDAISRMRELSIQAQNGTLSAGDRDVIQQEFQQLANQLSQTAGSVNFGGRQLLDGSLSDREAMRINDGNGGETAIEIGDMSAGALGVQNLDVADPNALAALDGAQAMLSSERARLGSLDNTFSRQLSQLASSRENAEAARSRIEDVDVAKATAQSVRDRLLMDLTLAGQRMSDRGSSRVLDLLS